MLMKYFGIVAWKYINSLILATFAPWVMVFHFIFTYVATIVERYSKYLETETQNHTPPTISQLFCSLPAFQRNFSDRSLSVYTYTSSFLTTSASGAGPECGSKVSVVLVSITEPNYNFKRGHPRLKINISPGNNTSHPICISPFGVQARKPRRIVFSVQR